MQLGVMGWPKSSFRLFHDSMQKNPNELFWPTQYKVGYFSSLGGDHMTSGSRVVLYCSWLLTSSQFSKNICHVSVIPPSRFMFLFFIYHNSSQNNYVNLYLTGFPGGSDGKVSACNAGDLGLIPGLRRSPGEGNGYLFNFFLHHNFNLFWENRLTNITSLVTDMIPSTEH